MQVYVSVLIDGFTSCRQTITLPSFSTELNMRLAPMTPALAQSANWSDVVAAAKEVKLGVPLVVRMKGTNEALGKKILADSGLPIITADNMGEAAERVVAASKGKN